MYNLTNLLPRWFLYLPPQNGCISSAEKVAGNLLRKTTPQTTLNFATKYPSPVIVKLQFRKLSFNVNCFTPLQNGVRRYIKYMIENGIHVIFRLAYKQYKYQSVVTTVNFLCMLLIHVTESSCVKWPSLRDLFLHDSTSSRSKWLFPSPKRQERLSWQASYSVGTGGVTPFIKWPERKAGRPPSSSSEVQVEWGCTSTPRIFFHGIAEGHFTSAEVQNCYILQHSLNTATRLRKHYHMIPYKIGLICLHTLYWDWRCILESVCSQTQLCP